MASPSVNKLADDNHSKSQYFSESETLQGHFDSHEIVYEDKKALVGKRLQEREEERLKLASKRKEENEQSASQTENLTFFMKTLTSNVCLIKEGLALASQIPKENLNVHFDSLSVKLGETQKFVTDSAIFLSSYDLAQKQLQLNDLQVEIATCRDKLMPKKKFAFKNKKKPVDSEKVPTAVSSQGNASNVTHPMSIQSKYDIAVNEHRIRNVCDQTIIVTADTIADKDVIISSANNCTIKIKGVPTAMHITDLVDCTVLCGPCSR